TMAWRGEGSGFIPVMQAEGNGKRTGCKAVPSLRVDNAYMLRTMIPLSILDLAPVPEGSDAGAALRNSVDLARHAEQWGYNRYWFAEHHNMPGVASAATAVVIGHVAAATNTLKLGAGGIML